MFCHDDTDRYRKLAFDWQRARVDELRADLADDSRSFTDADGARRWRSNPDSVISPSVIEDACLVPTQAQRDAYQAHLDAFFARARSAPRRALSAEECFEMEAAFGPGETVVDVITGQRWTT